MDEAKYRREFFKENTPKYTEMRNGRPVRNWIMGIKGIYQKLKIMDSGLQIEQDVQTFIRDAAKWWEIGKGLTGPIGLLGTQSLSYSTCTTTLGGTK